MCCFHEDGDDDAEREEDEEDREGLYKVWVNDVSCCAVSPLVVIMGDRDVYSDAE